MSGGLVVVTTGTQVPAGVLSWRAWEALRGAELVHARDGLDDAWIEALAASGVAVLCEIPRPATDLAQTLLDEAGTSSVVWFSSADGDPGLAEALTRDLVARSTAGRDAPEVEMVLGSWDQPGAELLRLVEVMDRLRSPGGCPWDAEQTHASLVPYALEEAFELAEAVESGDRAHLREELGDLLLQIVFHARVAQESRDDPFGVDEVAAGIVAKLVRRHPHVFAEVDAPTAAHVEANWEQIKQEEKGRESVMDGVPVALPALARADKVLGRLQRTGLPAERLLQVAQVELPTDLGAHLLGLVAAARGAGIDAEAALRQAVRVTEDAARAAETTR